MIIPHLAECLFSHERVLKRRTAYDAKVKRPPQLDIFLDPSDPYSRLLEAVLPIIRDRYDVALMTHLVSPPKDEVAPERKALAAYAKIDAQRLADKAGIRADLTPRPPVMNAEENDARLAALGHYQGGMIHYGGEWYWGLDRLHYLEARLADMGVRRAEAPDKPIFNPPIIPSGSKQTGKTLHWYLSFRSPYTAIVVDRVTALAEAYEADLKLRFVLPMVMRNLPVPKAKRAYIMPDTVREADRLRIPFGRISDPVGRPVERGYAVLNWAIQQGQGLLFVQSFLRLVWSQGVDAGSDRGLRRIVEAAGLDWSEAKAQLQSEEWREVAETNLQDMMSYGVWGVPSFRVEDTITWGQDRLWVIEDALNRE